MIIKNKILPLIMAVGVFVSPFMAACGPKDEKVPPEDDKKNEQVVPNPDDEKKEPDEKDEKQELIASEKAKLNVFLQELAKGDFKYNVVGENHGLGMVEMEAVFDDGKTAKVDMNGQVTYYMTEEGKDYVITNKNNVWYKDFADVETMTISDYVASLVKPLRNTTWTDFEDGTLIGKYGNSPVDFKILSEDSALFMTGGNICTISEMGNVSLTLPNYVDNTKPQENYVFQTKNGVTEYNLPLLRETLEKVIKEYDLLTKANYNVSSPLRKIVYVDTKDGIKFGVVYSGVKDVFGTYVIKPSLFADRDRLLATEFETILGNGNSVLSAVGSGYMCEATNLDQDKKYLTMFENIIEKYASDGCQGNSANNPTQRMPEYDNAEYLFAYKTPNSSMTSAYDLGSQTYSHYGLVLKKTNEEVEMLKMTVAVRVYGTASEGSNFEYYLINKDFENVVIVSVSSEKIDKENVELYEQTTTFAMSVSYTPYVEDKRYK